MMKALIIISSYLFTLATSAQAVSMMTRSPRSIARAWDCVIFIARRFGAHVGFDIAKGPEDTAFYLQFGHAWK